MAGTSFLIAVFMTIVSVSFHMPSRPPGQMKWGLEHWDWQFLLLIVQLGFDLLIGLSLALMCWTSRTRLTRWVLFVSTIAYPLLLGTCLLERASRDYWAPLVPIWSCVPVGLWAMITLRTNAQPTELKLAIQDETAKTAASTSSRSSRTSAMVRACIPDFRFQIPAIRGGYEVSKSRFHL